MVQRIGTTVWTEKYGPVWEKTVRSQARMETDKKTGPYGPTLWDCSLVRSQRKLDWTIQSSLRPDCKSGNCNSERFVAYERYS